MPSELENSRAGVPSDSGGGDEERDLAVDRAFGLAEEGDWEGAAAHLRELLESRPDDVVVLCSLGVVEQALGMDGVAYERFKTALGHGIEDPELLATAGAGLARFDDPEAEGVLRTATLLGPTLGRPKYLYGGYLAREGYSEEALKELDGAIELDDQEPLAFLERGVARVLAGQLEGGLDDFHRSTSLDPEDAWARVLVGLTLVELDRIEEATADLVTSARQDPEDGEVQLLASLAAAAAGDSDLAWEMLERARLVSPEDEQSGVEEIEDLLDDGPEPAVRALKSTFAPRALHMRLMTRP